MNKIFSLLTIVISLVACQKENNYFVDEPLRSYFADFEMEADVRNIDIDLKSMNIIGKMIAIEEDNIPGQCQYYKNETWVVIDPIYWEKMNDYDREALVFHELGHAALHREHLNSKGRHGECVSIMHSSSGTCKSMYNQATRRQYLDELFE